MHFSTLGLSPALSHAVSQLGFAAPTPIQAQCLPTILAGRDVIGIAKTGSGKTLAYTLPMLRHISVQPQLDEQQHHQHYPMALVLAPSRELAFQIHTVVQRYAKLLQLK